MTIFGSDEINRQNPSPKVAPQQPRSPVLARKKEATPAVKLPPAPRQPLTMQDQILEAIIIVCFFIEVAIFVGYTACSIAFSFMGIGIPFLIGAMIPYGYLHFLYVLWQGAKREGTSLVPAFLWAAIPVLLMLPALIQGLLQGGF